MCEKQTQKLLCMERSKVKYSMYLYLYSMYNLRHSINEKKNENDKTDMVYV